MQVRVCLINATVEMHLKTIHNQVRSKAIISKWFLPKGDASASPNKYVLYVPPSLFGQNGATELSCSIKGRVKFTAELSFSGFVLLKHASFFTCV